MGLEGTCREGFEVGEGGHGASFSSIRMPRRARSIACKYLCARCGGVQVPCSSRGTRGGELQGCLVIEGWSEMDLLGVARAVSSAPGLKSA